MRALTPVFLLLFLAAGSACNERNERNEPTKPESAAGEDPYRWLEDPTAPKVQAWITEQNERAEKALAAFPEGKAIAERVRALATTSVDRFGPKMAGGELFYLRNTPPEPQPVLVARKWPGGNERTLVDVNSEGGSASITGYWPSPSGRFVAYGIAYGGSELTTIHFRDVANGTTLDVSLPNAGGGTSPATLAWDADERGVTYMRWPGAPSGAEVRLFDAALYHHALEGGGADVPTFGESYSPIAEYELLASPDAKRVALLAKTGDGGPWEVYLRSKDRFERVLDPTRGVTSATFVGDRLLAVVTGDAPRGRIVAIEAQGQVTDLLAQDDWAIQSLAPVGRGFLVVRTWGPDWRVDHHDAQGKLVRRVALPVSGIQVEDIASETGAEQVILSCSGWATPRRWLRYDARNGELTPVFEVQPAGDYSHVVVERLDGRSPDGTAVPVTLVRLDSRAKDGTAPTILEGYGGFGVPFAPRFIGSRLAWLERGGVLAFATLRGGNELGEDWHEAGKGAHKQNVFDDFHAAARALIDAGWTAPERLGARGASNGGLLMGAQVTQHPETYRAVVSFVGIYDMLRHETFPNGAFNVTEYGSVKDPAQLAVLRAYSPLQRVQPKTAYPAVLLETGANDPRVAPWQSRKFAAALQAATTSDRPILLVTRSDAGHGVGAPFSQRVGNEALALTFFAHELGAKGS